MPRGISPETIFAKNRPEARPNEMRSAAVSVTYKPNACLPHVARCSPLSRYAKYSQCNTIATAPKVRASDTMAAITAGLHCPSQWCVIFSAVAASPVRKSSGITSANIPTLKIRPSIRWATKRNQNPAYVTLRVVLNPATPTFAGTRSPAAPASAPRTTGLPHDAQNTPSGVRTAPHLEQYTVILLDPRLLRLLAAFPAPVCPDAFVLRRFLSARQRTAEPALGRSWRGRRREAGNLRAQWHTPGRRH